MKLIDFASRIDDFYIWLRSKKWIVVEYRGSNDPDFKDYEVLGKGKMRMPDGKGPQWPITNYGHIKVVDIAGAA